MKKLSVGITGVSGFIGSHLLERLRRQENITIVPFEDSFFDMPQMLKDFSGKCDVIVHLAAMNRGDQDELYRTNVELVERLLASIQNNNAKPHVLFSSSTQCESDNPYGKSKKKGAELITEWADRVNAPASIMIIPNVFGDSGKPFYNSVVATFCYQFTHDQEPQIHVDNEIELIYINELTEIFFNRIMDPPESSNIMKIQATFKVKVSEIRSLLNYFKDHYYNKRIVPAFNNTFERNLYNTFLTYMENTDYEQNPVLHADNRGTLYEIIKQQKAGQIFFSTTKPGVTRGNHYHTRKMEKFCVIQGKAIIRLRRIGTDNIIEYKVCGDKPASIEMPIFYTHSIENIGNSDLLTLFWTNELFDPNDPDTFYENVLREKK